MSFLTVWSVDYDIPHAAKRLKNYAEEHEVDGTQIALYITAAGDNASCRSGN
ncbi:MAG TPA: hypothetical protein VFS76_15065 [Pyrinomonadaceae bacterium]|nr:hypothetical protein [Pyrinomonadaceae bacterium]